MDSYLLKLAGMIEEYCGVFIKKENDYNFKSSVKKNMELLDLTWDDFPFDRIVLQMIVEDLVIRETYFFREPKYLKTIEDEVKSSSAITTILSLGVSTGEEAYTVYMYFREKDLHDRIKVYGLDISNRSINFARKGIYSAHSLRKIERRYLKYFDEHDGTFTVKLPVKEKVQFLELHNVLNLKIQSDFPKQYDIVLARNFFIYHRHKIDDIIANILPLFKENSIMITTPVEFGKIKKIRDKNVNVTAI